VRKEPGRGRPRIAELDERILSATRELLAEHGYPGLSMEAVARKAGVGKQTLYRRWPRRPLLVYAAWFGGRDQTDTWLPDTGNLADDLAAATTLQQKVFTAPGAVELVSGLVADCLTEPALMDELRARMMRPDLEVAEKMFTRAVDRGELPEDTDTRALAQILAGAMFAHHVVYGGGLPGFERVLAAVMAGSGRR
jgi:AcrR family transcriptional regulator